MQMVYGTSSEKIYNKWCELAGKLIGMVIRSWLNEPQGFLDVCRAEKKNVAEEDSVLGSLLTKSECSSPGDIIAEGTIYQGPSPLEPEGASAMGRERRSTSSRPTRPSESSRTRQQVPARRHSTRRGDSALRRGGGCTATRPPNQNQRSSLQKQESRSTSSQQRAMMTRRL